MRTPVALPPSRRNGATRCSDAVSGSPTRCRSTFDKGGGASAQGSRGYFTRRSARQTHSRSSISGRGFAHAGVAFLARIANSGNDNAAVSTLRSCATSLRREPCASGQPSLACNADNAVPRFVRMTSCGGEAAGCPPSLTRPAEGVELDLSSCFRLCWLSKSEMPAQGRWGRLGCRRRSHFHEAGRNNRRARGDFGAGRIMRLIRLLLARFGYAVVNPPAGLGKRFFYAVVPHASGLKHRPGHPRRGVRKPYGQTWVPDRTA